LFGVDRAEDPRGGPGSPPSGERFRSSLGRFAFLLGDGDRPAAQE
jgi:hypothetical protein